MRLLLNILITASIAFVVVVLFYLYFPLHLLNGFQKQLFGATITTISSADQLSAFPTTYNANNAELNLRKPDLSALYATTTNQFAWTTLSSLATVGTITSGTWHGTAIEASYGGTGSSSLTANMVLLGNGTSPVKSTPAQGSNGQFLGMSGGVPTWLANSVDTTATYAWTGLHSFAATTTLARITSGAFSYVFPSLGMATSSAWGAATSTSQNASQVYLTPTNFSRTLEASTTMASISNSSTETTIWGSYIPADTLCTFGGCNGTLMVKVKGIADCGVNGNVHIYLYYGSLTVPVAGADGTCKGNGVGPTGFDIEAMITATSTNAQRGYIQALDLGRISAITDSPIGGFTLTSSTTPTGTTANQSGYIATNAQAQQQLKVTFKFDSGASNNTVTPWIGTLEVIKP